MVVLAFRRASAWALPRPSAIASAKLAKRTVNQSQRVTWRVKPTSALPVAASRRAKKVVTTLPTSTTNITGFFATCRGSSLTKASFVARRTRAGSKRLLRFGDFGVGGAGTGGRGETTLIPL